MAERRSPNSRTRYRDVGHLKAHADSKRKIRKIDIGWLSLSGKAKAIAVAAQVVKPGVAERIQRMRDEPGEHNGYKSKSRPNVSDGAWPNAYVAKNDNRRKEAEETCGDAGGPDAASTRIVVSGS